MIQLCPPGHSFSLSNPFNGEATRIGWPKRPCPLFSAPFISAPLSRVRVLDPLCSKHMLPPRPPPISKLPFELLSIIFMLSYEPEDDDPDMRLILSHVCRHWRNVIRHMPRLWTQISVTWDLLCEDDDSNPWIETNLISLYLALSGDCPLHIHIDVRDDDWDGTEPEIDFDDLPDYDLMDTGTGRYDPNRLSLACLLIMKSLPLLVPHLHRWESFGVFTDTWAPMFLALNLTSPYLTKFGAPRLESLTLMRCNGYICFTPMFEPKHLMNPKFLSQKNLGDDANPALNNGSAANILPRLKHLELTGVPVDWEVLVDAIEANQVGGLKALYLRSLSKQVTPSRAAFIRLLNASPKLESLIVNTAGPSSLSDSQAHDSLGRARLDKLQMLEIGYRSEAEAEVLMGSISTSTVREVVLKYEENIPGHHADTDGVVVLGYLTTEERGQRPLVLSDVEELGLESFWFQDNLMGSEALGTVLAKTTRLKRLNVVDMGVEDMLRSLTPKGTKYPCPELQSLSIRFRPSYLHMGVLSTCIPAWMEMVTHFLGERKETSTLKEVIIEVERYELASVETDKAEATIGETFVSIFMSLGCD